MSNDQKVKLAVMLWFAVFATSLLLRFFMPIEGEGFLRGIDRGVTMIAGQVIAAAIAMATRNLALRLPETSGTYRLGHIPIFATIGVVVLALGSIIWAVQSAK
jgi:hypothetical protein